MVKKKSKKVEDFKQVKIKVGKKLPKNTNVTKPNFKCASIIIRPQIPLKDIEDVDEAKRLIYKKYLKQLSYHNTKKQADAANKLKSLLKSDPNHLLLYNDTIVEMMKMYATMNIKTNHSILELASYLLSKLNMSNMEPLANRIWLSLSIGLTDILTIKQQCSLKFLWLIMDYFPLLLLKQTNNVSFLVDLVVLTDNINFNKLELISRVNNMFKLYLNDVSIDWYYSNECPEKELEMIHEFSAKFINILKPYLCPDIDYLENIGSNYEMISYKLQKEVVSQTENISIGFTTLKNLILFYDKFYYQNIDLKESSLKNVCSLFYTQIVSDIKHIFPISDVSKVLTDKIDPINLIYCDIVCSSLSQISLTAKSLIVGRICCYLTKLLNFSIPVTSLEVLFKDGLLVIDRLLTLYYSHQNFYDDNLINLLKNIFDCDVLSTINMEQTFQLIQTATILLKNLDLTFFNKKIFEMEYIITNFINTVIPRINENQAIQTLELLYYCQLKLKNQINNNGENIFGVLAVNITNDFPNLNYFTISLNFLSCTDLFVLKHFLKYCIQNLFTDSTLSVDYITSKTNYILKTLTNHSETKTLLSSFMYTCSIGFTLNEMDKVQQILAHNSNCSNSQETCSLIPTEMILNDSMFELLDKQTLCLQRLLILFTIFETLDNDPNIFNIYMDIVKPKVYQFFNNNPYSCHINILISMMKINDCTNEYLKDWSPRQLQLLSSFLVEFNLATSTCIDSKFEKIVEKLILEMQNCLHIDDNDLPPSFMNCISNILDSMVRNSDHLQLECFIDNLLIIYKNHVLPSCMKKVLAEKLKGNNLNFCNYERLLDKIA